MSGFIQRILKVLAYSSAAIVVLLAILLGLFRLLLPRLPEYQDELKAWASEAIGAEVEFAGMDARWGLRGPELSFYDAELIRPATGTRAIAASEVGIIVSLPELLFEQSLVVDTVRVRNSSVELREQPDGSWELQGTPMPDLMPGGTRIASITLIGEDIDVLVLRTGDQRPTRLELRRIDASRDAKRTAVDASVRLPDELGTSMTVSATQMTSADGDTPPLNVSISAGGLRLAGLSALYRHPERQVTAGQGSVDLSFALVGTRLQNVSASANLKDVSLNGGAAFDLSGLLAYNAAAAGWLLAGDELELRTGHGAWPLSTFRIEAGTDPSGGLREVDVRAAHVDFADTAIVAGWLPERERSLLEKWQPDGIVHNLVSTLKDLDTDSPEYAISAELDRAGIAASGDMPGVRGFSGSLRADRAGGLLTVDGENLTVDVTAWVTEPVELDRADGTFVWRRSGTRTTILSDNIVLSNALFDTRSNIEISLDGGSSPVVDLASTWRVADIAVAKRFIPRRIMTEKLHQWFQDALLSGRVTAGSARLKGPLDRFPFDDGDGELRVEARIEALDFLYHPRFPVVNVSSMGVVLENTHLYTRDNRAVTAGNTAVDAAVDIRDLRRPVLTIDARASGTLASLHAFASTSPVGQVFGGHLDKVHVDGASTMTLELRVPLQSWQEFDFTATVTSSDGSMRITGFDPPLTELAGTVTVQRDHVESEGLAGRLLGGPVHVEVNDAGPGAPGYKVLASARGTASAVALIDELSLPLEGLLAGQADYRAELRLAAGEPGGPQAEVRAHAAGRLFLRATDGTYTSSPTGPDSGAGR
jgi:uncharacterized protein YhdP